MVIRIILIGPIILMVIDRLILVRKEIKNVAKLIAFYCKKFSILALGAGNSCKLPVLNIKKFGQKTSCSSCFPGFKMLVSAFWTRVF